jgi:hypothetical protein
MLMAVCEIKDRGTVAFRGSVRKSSRFPAEYSIRQM